MLRHPPISALAYMPALAAGTTAMPHATTSGVVQVGGRLGLVLSLDGVRLCVVPLGVRTEREPETTYFS
jgi:hypothetical protein